MGEVAAGSFSKLERPRSWTPDVLGTPSGISAGAASARCGPTAAGRVLTGAAGEPPRLQQFSLCLQVPDSPGGLGFVSVCLSCPEWELPCMTLGSWFTRSGLVNRWHVPTVSNNCVLLLTLQSFNYLSLSIPNISF